jgi:hypothetical protein
VPSQEQEYSSVRRRHAPIVRSLSVHSITRRTDKGLPRYFDDEESVVFIPIRIRGPRNDHRTIGAPAPLYHSTA